jgi:hypothetical protein
MCHSLFGGIQRSRFFTLHPHQIRDGGHVAGEDGVGWARCDHNRCEEPGARQFEPHSRILGSLLRPQFANWGGLNRSQQSPVGLLRMLREFWAPLYVCGVVFHNRGCASAAEG